jgi:hypothetical protein
MLARLTAAVSRAGARRGPNERYGALASSGALGFIDARWLKRAWTYRAALPTMNWVRFRKRRAQSLDSSWLESAVSPH